ncbi:tripartite tricarboxylate transporter substrate binding protein [Verticiella sediminum]|uniref:Tripartite tricarboxylate transporter substrate binding protein n=1 Tax=Verticiella sediminum TaxID=1247510 RepID=A0A556AJG7_9BURK|nr:tripartite tricarboxylate transporter substrate binding protein [Verticiella sediminum]TSH93054.1 tripartite tricarboxylate transporter substrate binding protein [Verticiella sediminum]
MKLNRRSFLHRSAALGALACPALLRAQPQYPDAPIRFLIPTPVGGGHDTMMRLIGQKLTEAWGQPCLVESRSGGSGMVSIGSALNAPADGYTFLLTFTGFVTNLVLQPSPNYTLADLAPVCMLCITPVALGVRRSLGVNTLEEFVRKAKAEPGKLSYASYGQGSAAHFVGEMLSEAAGIQLNHVPYRGEAPAIQEVLGEHVDACIVSVGGVMRYPDRMQAVAVASPTRFPLYQALPTFAEAGYASVDFPGWAGVHARAGTPQAIVERVSAELARIVKLPDVAPRLLELGFEPVGWNPDQTGTFVKEQLDMAESVARSGRVRI